MLANTLLMAKLANSKEVEFYVGAIGLALTSSALLSLIYMCKEFVAPIEKVTSSV